MTTAAGLAESPTDFKPLPKLSSAAPSPAQAGDTLSLTGTNLADSSSAKLGATVLGGLVVDSPTQLHVSSGASSVTGVLTVTTPGGVSAGLNLGVRPTLVDFSPGQGAAGQLVTITGNTLAGRR